MTKKFTGNHWTALKFAFFEQSSGLNWVYCIKKSDLINNWHELVRNDTLTVLCEVSLHSNMISFVLMFKNTNLNNFAKKNIKYFLHLQLKILPNIEETVVVANPSQDFSMNNCNSIVANNELLLGDNKFSNVILVVDGEEVKANKIMLTSCSPVFNGMFQAGMSECNENRVHIPDVEKQVFMKLLEYIYTGKVTNMVCFAEKLLPIADKVCYHFEILF